MPGPAGPGTLGSTPQVGSPGFNVTFNNAFALGGYEVVWNGETSVVGDLTSPPVAAQQWAYIKGPGRDL